MKMMIHNISKKHKSFIAALLAVVMVVSVFTFAAPISAQAVELSAEEKPFYNISYGANGETTFDAGTQILLINNTAKEAGKEKSEAVYTLSGEETLTWNAANEDAYVVWQGTSENTFYGVYPYTAACDSFTLPTEQDTAEELATADWMTATATAANTNGSLNLEFAHLLSKVTVKVSGYGTQYTGSETITDVKIYSLGTSLTATYGDDVTVTTENNETAILANSDANGYTAIVAPGAYQAEDTFISLQVNGEELTVSVKDNEALLKGLDSGKHYTFNLKVGKDKVELAEVTVNGWTDGGSIECGEAERIYALSTIQGSTQILEVYTGGTADDVRSLLAPNVSTVVIKGAVTDEQYNAVVNSRSTNAAVFFADLGTNNYIASNGATYTCVIGSESDDKYVLIVNELKSYAWTGNAGGGQYDVYLKQLTTQTPGARAILYDEAAWSKYKELFVANCPTPDEDYTVVYLLLGNTGWTYYKPSIAEWYVFRTWYGSRTYTHYWYPVFDVPLS